ncbi:hypothetical protein EAS61_29070 [Bradyrhizobium zhanjiangense]|uniref:Uncharacterized protein n=1 Tax=Bradyrhizobium zhanjiangense TaxID=1325107 RepID=A0A4Q0QEQ3_9BRAD|nr:hypothetical protein EAS61_29070 [Bradyrhizobium zhanjiangense]
MRRVPHSDLLQQAFPIGNAALGGIVFPLFGLAPIVLTLDVVAGTHRPADLVEGAVERAKGWLSILRRLAFVGAGTVAIRMAILLAMSWLNAQVRPRSLSGPKARYESSEARDTRTP